MKPTSADIGCGLKVLMGLAVIMVPVSASSNIAAKQSRILTIHLRGPAGQMLATFASSAMAAGMTCRFEPIGAHHGVACTFPVSKHHRGGLVATDIDEKKAIFVSAYASNVSNPHGELDPDADRALANFTRSISNDQNVRLIDQCIAPSFDKCALN